MVDKDDLKFVGMFLAENYSHFSSCMSVYGFNRSECDEMIRMLDPDYEGDD